VLDVVVVCVGGGYGLLHADVCIGCDSVVLEVVLYALLVIVIFGSCCGVLEMVVVFVGGGYGVYWR
jgi:hypothetical protein